MKTNTPIQKNNSVTPNNFPKIDNGFSGVLDPKLLEDEKSLLRHIASTTEQSLGKGEASIFLVTGPLDKQVITYKAGSSDITHQRLSGVQLQIGEGVVGYTIKTGMPQLIADVRKLKNKKNGPTFYAEADERSDYPTRSLACAPMIAQDQVIGAIEIVDELPNRFSSADLSHLSSIADFSARVIQESKHIQAFQRQSKLLTARAKVITQAVAHLDNLENLLEKITDSFHLNFDCDYVGLYLLDDNDDQDSKLITLKATAGKKHEIAANPLLEIGNKSTLGWATAHGKPCIALHIAQQEFRIRYVDSPQAKDEQDVSKFAGGNKLLTEPSSAVTLPLIAYGETIGAIIIQNESPTCFAEENFPDEDINVLQTLAGQLAFIIHHAGIHQQIALKKQNLEIIQDIDRQIIGTTDQNLTENLRLILLKGLEFIGAESGQIFRYDDKTKTLVEKVSTTKTSAKEPQPIEGVFEYVVSSKKSALIEELQNWEPAATMNSRLTVPLITGDLVIGILNAESSQLKAFNQRHQEIIEALAPQATIAIQNAYLFKKKTHRASLLQAASEVSSNAISIRNLDHLLDTTVGTIVDKFGYYHAAIFLVDNEKNEWVVLQADSSKSGQKMLPRGYRIRIGSDTPVGQATGPFRKLRRTLYPTPEKNQFKNPYLPEARSEIALPLSVKAGKKYKMFGALNVHSTEETAFADKDTAMLQTMADQLAVIISNDRLYRQTEKERQLVEVLREIDRRILNLDESKTDLLNFILTESCRLTGAENGQVFLVERDELKVEVATKTKDLNARVSMVVGTVIGDAVFDEYILIADLKELLSQEQAKQKENYIDYNRAYKKNRRSRAAVRIHEEDGNVVGVLSVDRYEPGQFTAEHLEILSALAGQAAIAIKNRALIAQAEVRNRRLEATAQVGADIISNLNVEALLNKTVNLIHQKFNLYYAGVFLIEKVEKKGRKQRIAELKAASSADGRQLSHRERQFEVGGKSMVGFTTGAGQAKITQVTLGGGDGAALSGSSTLPETLSKMTLPLRNGKEVIGALEVQSVETIFTEADTKTLQTMADQLAIAIYNAELYQQTEEDKQQLAALRDIERAIISTELNLDQTLKLILTKGLDLIEAKHGSLSLLEPDKEHLIVFISSQKEEIGSVLPVDKSILGLAIEKRHSIRIPDISLEPRYQTDYNLFSGSQIASMLLVPLKDDNSISGVFSVYSTQTNAFSEKQQKTLETLAGQAAIAIKNASLYSQAQRRAALLKAAAKVSQSVISVFDLDQLLNKIVNTICDEFEEREFHYAAVFLVDETGRYAWQRAGTGQVGRQRVAQKFKFKVSVDDSIVSAVIQNGQGAIEEYNWYPDESPHTKPLLPDTQSEMALPLKLGDKVMGVLAVHSRQKNAFTDEDTQTLQSMADQLAIAIDNVKKQEKLVEAETLKTIDEATSQSMHWVANKARPIKDYIERIDKEISPFITQANIDERIQEDFFEALDVIKQNTGLILEVKQEIMGTAREFELVKAELDVILAAVLKLVDFPPKQIKLSLPPDLPPVQVDRPAIEEVFRNLCVNAIQAMKDKKSPLLQIRAKTREGEDFVEVKVIDNGVGISANKIRDIWTPFYTTKAGTGGTGVGLSYCLQAMHKMDGKIRAESQIGQGTTFILMIPIYRES